MTSPIFIDANVPIYAIGREHPLKAPSRRVLTVLKSRPAAFITDAEVLQELLHRYLSLRMWKQARSGFREFVELVRGHVEPMTPEDVELAATLADHYAGLSARDLVHLAVMHRLGATRIVSADGDFDHIAGIDRLDPMLVDEWADTIDDAI